MVNDERREAPGAEAAPALTRLLHGFIALAAVALIAASIDHAAGLSRLWFSSANAVQELQSLALAAAFYFFLALGLAAWGRIVAGSAAVSTGRLCPGLVGPALVAACLAALLDTDALHPDAPLRRSLLFPAVVAAGLTFLLAAARRALMRRWPRPIERIDARLDRHLLPAAFAMAGFALGLWLVRNRFPLEWQTVGRLSIAGLAGSAWIAALLLVETRSRALLQAPLLVGFAALLGGAAWSALPQRAAGTMAGTPPPAGVSRIVLITIDTLRADALGCYGTSGTLTPHLDRLASRGIRFEQAISPSSWTLPSVASIMTGLSVPAHGATTTSSALPDAASTLAACLRDAGYATGAVGVNPHLAARRGLERGFDQYDFYPRSVTPWDTLGGRIRKALRPFDFLGVANSSQVTGLALQWMRRHRDRPFLLWCHYFDPHVPYTPPPAFMPDPPPARGFRTWFEDVGGIRTGRFDPSDEERDWIRELYLAEVRYVDREVGRLLDGLARLGPPEETLIILTSDHGEEFWEHDAFEHGHSLHREVLHVPWLIALPGRLAPAVIHEPVSLTSLPPTVLSLLGLAYDPAAFSEAALPIENPDPVLPPVFSAGILYGPHAEAVIDENWKLIRTPSESRSQIFDLARDPEEARDRLAHDPERAAELARSLDGWLAASRAVRERLGVSDSAPVDLPEATLEQLRKLGYID